MNELFKLDDENRYLNHFYRYDNYKVVDGLAKNNKCLLFCSSNGIYYPNDFETFRHKIVCNDFYEWSRIGSLCIEYVERIIFIRDIRKNFYVTGINARLDTIDKMLEMLRQYTEGYELTVAGGSAGGYVATILGVKLGAKKIISQGGIWNLYKNGDTLEKYYFLNKSIGVEGCEQYYNLDNIMGNCKTPIFYIYGAHNKSDIIQSKCAGMNICVYNIGLNSENHAPAISTIPYIYLLLAESTTLKGIFERNKDRIVEIGDLEKQILNSVPSLGVNAINVCSTQDKKDAYSKLLYEWVLMKQKNTSLSINGGAYAVWGSGKYCSLLLNELNNANNVNVKCIIESNPLRKEYNGYPIVPIEKMPSDVDIIIVIPYYDIENIKAKIKACKCTADVIGIDEWLEQLKQ